MSADNLFSNLLTAGILLTLLLIVYLKMSHKTLLDLIRDIREAFSDGAEEVIDVTTNNRFQDIR